MVVSNRGTRRTLAGLELVLALFLVLAMVPVVWPQETSGTQPSSVVQDIPDAGSKVKSQRISLNLQNATLGSVLKVMTQRSGINFLIGSDLVGKEINVYLEDVLVEDALAAIMRANGLWYTRQKGTNIYVIMDAPEGPPVATITEALKANYADAIELEPTVKSVLTDAGSIVVDPRTNTLVVSDIPENMSTVQSLVGELDDPTGQVLIEAKIVEFAEDASSELGINWDFSTFAGPDENGKGAASYGTTFNSGDNEGILELTLGKFASYVEIQDLTARLSAMQKDGLAEVLAKPQILTLDNKEAVIEITQHMALAKKVTYREGGQESTVEPIFGDVGVTLKVTPHLNNDEFVTMRIEPTVSSAQRSSFFPDDAVDTKSRTARTTVMVKDGQTVVIGGLLRKDVVETAFKVPLLGDIPLLGQLFRKSIKSDTRTEVMVFLTPRILGPEALQRMSQDLEKGIDQKVKE
jgi:type IV pilus assembly protein PilQ